jgi:hypothetical protein
MTINDDIRAVATCASCQWQAEMKGPPLEVAKFLRERLISHVEHECPKRPS